MIRRLIVTTCMLRIILFALSILSSINLLAQKEYQNTRSSNHKTVAGTPLALIPPDGFAVAQGFQGFQQQESNASIMVSEIPGPFSETTRGFNERDLNAQGVTLKKKEAIRMNGMEGYFIITEQNAYNTPFVKYILTFGDVKSTFIITGMYPKKFKELDDAIVKALYSVVYDPATMVNPVTAVPFKINTNNTKFKFAKLISGSLLYTVDGKVPTESNDKTTFIVGQAFSKIETDDKKLFALNRLSRMPYQIDRSQNKVNEVEIDGLHGYEIETKGTGSKSGVINALYQVMLFSEGSYYILFGSAEDEFEANMEVFKQLAKSFEKRR